MLWAGRHDSISLTNMVELLASAGQAKGFSSKNGEGNEKRAGKNYVRTVSRIINTANFSLLKKIFSNLKTTECIFISPGNKQQTVSSVKKLV